MHIQLPNSVHDTQEITGTEIRRVILLSGEVTLRFARRSRFNTAHQQKCAAKLRQHLVLKFCSMATAPVAPTMLYHWFCLPSPPCILHQNKTGSNLNFSQLLLKLSVAPLPCLKASSTFPAFSIDFVWNRIQPLMIFQGSEHSLPQQYPRMGLCSPFPHPSRP